MLSMIALGSAFTYASNEQGNVLYGQDQIIPSFKCYQIVATTGHSINYGITHFTKVTTYKKFTSDTEVEAYIEQLKIENPDNIINGTGYKTFYGYSQVSIIYCIHSLCLPLVSVEDSNPLMLISDLYIASFPVFAR